MFGTVLRGLAVRLANPQSTFFFIPILNFPQNDNTKKTEAGAFVPMSSDQLSALQIFLAHLRAWRTSCASRPERTS